MTRDDALALDAADALAPLRQQFVLPPGLIYLDGNSLGVLPKATAAPVQEVVQQEWGVDLIRSWNSAGWIDLSQRVGDKIAQLVGAGAGELVVADSTSVNLFKVLSAALSMAQADAPQRRRIVSERSNFPTDLYIAEALARERGLELVLAETDDLPQQLDARCAVLMLTHVNYRSGRMHDMAALSRAASDAGALVVWDLAHSAGAVPVDLHADGAEPDPRWVNLLQHQIQAAEVELVAELAHAPATVEQLLSFKPGDFIELDLDAQIQAKVDGVPILDCHYGTANKRYAIKIDRLITSSTVGWLGAQTDDR